MDSDSSMEVSIPEYVLLPLFSISKSSSLNEALEILIEASRTSGGRADLAMKNLISIVLRLIQSLSYPLNRILLLLSLKFLRNLCAGERENQDSFVEQNGVEIVSTLLTSISDSDCGFIRMGLQALANVLLAGEKHQHAVWYRFFPDKFVRIARVQKKDTCDPLCMILYTCLDGNNGLLAELCGAQGLPIVSEIVRTTSAVGFGEDWLKLLLSRICIEESYFPALFSKLHPVNSESSEDAKCMDDQYVTGQVFLLSIISEILNEQFSDIIVSSDFALYVLQIFKTAIGAVDFFSRSKSGLPTGSTAVDVLGYSVTILRDICVQDGMRCGNTDRVDGVDTLLSAELLEMLFGLLHDLEPPSIIKKVTKQGENHEGTTSITPKLCPYKGFRRDVVAVIGNCAYQRKHVQDEIRRKNGILLLLQQCVTDADDPFLREWGIWSVRNLLEGNRENQRVVAELEIQGSINVPEISGLGLRVEVDHKTRQAKLVNIS